MGFRRGLVVVIGAAVAAALDWGLWCVLAPGGWTVAKVLMMGSFALATPWVGFCTANGTIGFVLVLRRPVAAELAGAVPRTAIAVTVRNEDMGTVLPPLRRLLDGLDAAAAEDRFAVWVLSDTGEPGAAAAEEAAVAAFRAADRDPGRIHYRRRTRNEAFKAGNIMDFLDHHAAGYEAMLVLDADSQMSARAALRLARTLQANPHLAIVQHLTVGLPAPAPFTRLFQFGMRAGMRTWAGAVAWWQGDESCYWGHNAIVRIAPFRRCARLPLLPGGRHILSHDQVEAALLAGAGWGVRLLPQEDGSYEANPPALPEFVRREMRWLAGNLEYRHLLGLRGLRLMGRWQLIQAILLFGCAPLYLVLALAAAWAAVTDRSSPFSALPALAVSLGWIAAIYAPKLLGYLDVLLRPAERGRYGGGWRVTAGAGIEIVFAMIVDAITLLNKTATVLRLLAGRPAGWPPQNRATRAIPWSEAARLFWPQTVLGIALLAAFAAAGWTALLWAVPFLGGAAVAIPFCVWTAAPRAGAFLRRHGLASIPEEVAAAGGRAQG